MKKNKGFTLVETLGVLIILIIIGMIMIPSLKKIIKNTNYKIDAATSTIIKSSTTDFLFEKSDIYPKSDDNTYCITLGQLIDNSNLTEKQIATLEDKEMIVKTTFIDNKPIYEITKNCEAISIGIEFNLVGKSNLSFEVGVGGQYVEPGAIAKNKANDTVSYTVTITNSSKETVAYVDTTKIDIYAVKYTSLIDGKDYSIERIVKVVDTTEPAVVVNPNATILSITNDTYNVLEGVTSSDNSGEIPKITARTNLSLGQSGTYSITYTATDSSGNKKTAKRTVIVSNRKLVTISIGPKNVTHEINSGIYIDAGATATDASSNNLSSELVKTIRKGGKVVGEVAVDKLATYYITYSIIKDNVTYSETRTVVIIDTTKPVITGATTTTIYSNNTTFNVMAGVSVSDNSGETLAVNTVTNLTLGILGTYNVTYNVSDLSGNTTTIMRTIKINPIYPVYANGTVIYFNPVSGLKCNLAAYIANIGASDNGTKTGCMKWYTFNDGGIYSPAINLLLDHNTTAMVMWNSTGFNAGGMREVASALISDTSSWVRTLNPRLITALEVAAIAGPPGWQLNDGWYFFSSNTASPNSICESPNLSGCTYRWLYDRTSMDSASLYGSFNNASSLTYGYWTSSTGIPHPTIVWGIYKRGILNSNSADYTYYGVRPVISLLKSNIQ